MFRMLQALEREPVNLATQTSKQGTLVSVVSFSGVFITSQHTYLRHQQYIPTEVKATIPNHQPRLLQDK